MSWEECLRGVRSMPEHYGMAEADLRAIFDLGPTLPQGAVVVELGVCNGRGSACFAYMTKALGGEYHAVDDFRLESSADEWQSRMASLGLDFALHVESTQSAGASWNATWRTPIDLLILDAGHDEENVAADCQLWLPWVKLGGYAVFDDWDSVQRSDPHWAVAYYGDLYTKGWRDLGTAVRARIRQRPA